MTYCDYCDKEMKIDEWREHIISKKHLEKKEKRYCEVCHMKYHMSEISKRHISEGKDSDRGHYHICRDFHQKKREIRNLF